MKDKKDVFGFKNSFNGIKSALLTERNVRFHFTMIVIVCISGILFNISKFEWLFVVLAIALVVQAEIMNTSIEKLLDHVRPEIHPAAKIVKDLAAGAVFCASIGSFIVGIIIFLPKFIDLF